MRWEEAQPVLPRGWVWTTIGETSDTQLGKMLSRKSKTGFDEQPYLRNQNVQWNRISLDDLATMEFTPAERVKFDLRGGDIVVCEGGEVGRAAVWRERLSTYYFQKAIHRIRTETGVLPEYLMFSLWTMAQRRLLGDYTSGSTIAHLPQEDLRKLAYPLAPVLEQVRIVAELERRLSHIDAAHRDLRSAQRRLVALRRAILDGVARGSILDLDSSEWKDRPTGSVGEVRGGIQKQPKRAPVRNAFPFLRVANVARGSLDLAEVHQIELFEGELTTYQLVRGDLLVVEGNGSIDQIGRAAMWDGSIEACVHQNHLIRVRPGDGVVPEFLALVWNAPSTIEQLRSVASSTSGLHTLSTAKVKSVRLRLPSVDVQQQLVAEAERRLSIVDVGTRAVSAGLLKVDQLRLSTLLAAFSGQLVEQDPDDEPAEETLARIRRERAIASPRKQPGRKTKAS